MKKIISLVVIFLSVAGLYALNPPAWMMGYWFDRNSESVVSCGLLRVTPDNIIFGTYLYKAIDFYLDLSNAFTEASDFAEHVEEYADDEYTITRYDKNTGDVISIWSFTHDRIDNRIIYYLWNNGKWNFGWSYGRTKPGNISYSLLP